MDVYTHKTVDRRIIYTIGGIAALLTVLVGVVETGISFLPGGKSNIIETVVDWFTFYQNNPFMALRNWGLLNMFFNVLAIPLYAAVYTAHSNSTRSLSFLAMIIAFIGIAVFFATNRAFPMLELSQQYSQATTEVQKAALIAAGQALLSVGQSHTPGTFIAFLFANLAGILMSYVMLQDKIFTPTNAVFGILGFALLLIFEVLASFIISLDTAAYILATVGGLLCSIWEVMLALKLFQLKR